MAQASRSLQQFCELARRGQYGHASSGEVAARNIAVAILDNIHSLDDQTKEGLAEFLRYAPENARQFGVVIDQWPK